MIIASTVEIILYKCLADTTIVNIVSNQFKTEHHTLYLSPVLELSLHQSQYYYIVYIVLHCVTFFVISHPLLLHCLTLHC